MRIIKKLKWIVFSGFIACLASMPISFALSNTPSIQFDRFKGEYLDGVNSINLNARGEEASYFSFFGFSTSTQQVKEFFEYFTAEGAKLTHLSNMNLALLSGDFPPDYAENIHLDYVISQNIVIGYNLLEPLVVMADESKPNSVIKKIKALPLRTIPLSPTLQVPANMSLQVYEKRQAAFIERYVLVSIQTDLPVKNYLVVDAFYPEALDSTLSGYTVKFLQAFLNGQR
ncbi:hypothetical protein COW36_11620 [bacterium (Candidatus Blackallbacteria) CG17_big_fil_post_rev_8_21_14_2_50_48_46]|uniref:Uncharacterized protein n=1 Tax=bacterium (Candidatus Blackallbacteria) CG17_big_fil_post_rev_8_21_14_2_50_48_46 TaxID=2014261 RepID=A0A2M7G4G0_9BACT|nr:MAG: hypothetical protein COW64_21840 [bacterium (Candidatus Blackallbacteria) CG18_big_fil_WC_8_21_14_2_50_49_26]PIW16785.1 MAG: hypothetical protein COW36_11620 [bacterium (Candidatus Blackallbacteria) CG17_big_fil_post_rev_8_21_14_2_50_48_46]PIW47071.1 MAG: hypothetical protein COW20_13800 [bacterium (Candidatus Blackallbacteria) CG13_big_fil_rev_8_21_14_2_50_49_14]